MELKHRKLLTMLEDMQSAADIAKDLGIIELAISINTLARIALLSRKNSRRAAQLLISVSDYCMSFEKELKGN